jgi:Na+/H+-dicarboxylate symporter
LIPKNPFAAATQGDMLPVIFFALLIGVFISVAEHNEGSKDASVVRRFFSGLFDVMMQMTLFVVKFAPIGVFGFTLYAAAGKGPAAFQVLGWYVLTVFIALVIHATITLPLILKLRTGRSPIAYARTLITALITAFSTASSNGTLPLTMENVERAGVRPQVTSFVLPLGATINMDGTALYEAVAVLFIAQVYGIDLSLTQQALVAFTALLASIGAAGIPHAGMVMMVVVLNAVGLPTSAVALILAVDRILDMCRTTVNVWSDSIAAAVVDAGE